MRLTAALLFASACNGGSTPPPAPGPCAVYFSGDVSDTASVPQCAALSEDADAGTWTLSIGVSSPKVPELAVTIDFASAPATGVVSSDTVASWSAVENVGADACAFGAGSAAVPTGSFTLSLASIDASAEGGTPDVHGTLDLVLYVHAPQSTDCGPEEVENVEVRF